MKLSIILNIKMIVCVCKSVCDRKILNVIQEGAHTVKDVTSGCSAGGDCGSCHRAIAEMILKTRSDSSPCLRAAVPADKRAA